MPRYTLIPRGVRYYRRQHAALFTGAVLTAAIITGALLVGDSVDGALRDAATARLGAITHAVMGSNRFFSDDLPARIQQANDRIHATGLLLLRGSIATPPGGKTPNTRLNRAQVIGVDSSFWSFAVKPWDGPALGPQEAAIDERTAGALGGLAVGDALLVRMERQRFLPIDAPLADRKDDPSMSLLVTVKAVLTAEQLGCFGLAANQTPPHNVFLNRAWLQEQTSLRGKINALAANGAADQNAMQDAIKKAWRLDDAGVHWNTDVPGVIQLESERVFLDDAMVRAALACDGASPSLTYLVNRIAKGNKATPYSFVVAGATAELKEDEAVINQWTAEQLDAKPGDTINVSYYQLKSDNTFAEQSHSFTVRSIAPMDSLAAEKTLAPQFPGLSDVESCSDWDAGMPMDEETLKDPANEAYWRAFGQTPKLLTSFETGRALWGNRFGSATAIRFTGKPEDASQLAETLRAKIDPATAGLQSIPVRDLALAAVTHAIDFGGLFVAMSFFLMAAAVILLGLLYSFSIQQRAREIGILLALGFTPRRVQLRFLCEAVPTALAGAVLGALAGILYARALLAGLAWIWPGAVAGTRIPFHASFETLVTGACVALACALMAAAWTLRRAVRRPAHDLLTADPAASSTFATRGRQRIVWRLVPYGCMLLAAGIGFAAWRQKSAAMAEPFFGAGSMFLIGMIGLYANLLASLGRRATRKRLTFRDMAMANLTRRRGRSVSVAALTACGCFLVFAVSAMQVNIALHAGERTSGDGGFGIYAETAIPLTGSAGDLAKMFGHPVVPLRVHDGDDASCLNLNRAQQPRILGVDPARLAALGAFSARSNSTSPWTLLEQTTGTDGMIPALAGDANTALWGLKMKADPVDGGVIMCRDDAGGEASLRLAGQLPMPLSVFQGSVIISEEAFTRLFPNDAGFRAFLVDAPHDAIEVAVADLNQRFERNGMDAVSSLQRMRDFYAVESSYISLFLVLGGLGLMLGAGGAGIVVLRNLLERRNETALFDAIGFERARTLRLMVYEQSALVLAGAIIGALAAALAIIPVRLASQTPSTHGVQVILFAGIILAHLAVAQIIPRFALRGVSIDSLRDE